MFIHDSIQRDGDCQVGHGPKSIVLQLEDEIEVVEGRSYGRWIDWPYSGRATMQFYQLNGSRSTKRRKTRESILEPVEPNTANLYVPGATRTA